MMARDDELAARGKNLGHPSSGGAAENVETERDIEAFKLLGDLIEGFVIDDNEIAAAIRHGHDIRYLPHKPDRLDAALLCQCDEPVRQTGRSRIEHDGVACL
jgi:hypothetical protein